MGSCCCCCPSNSDSSGSSQALNYSFEQDYRPVFMKTYYQTDGGYIPLRSNPSYFNNRSSINYEYLSGFYK